MLQSQRVPYFMGQNQLDQFALHRVGQQDIPSIGVIGPALYEIPFLENIQYTAENTDMTTDDLSRPRFAGSGSVSIVLTGYFPRYKWIGGVIHAKFRVFGSIRCQSSVYSILKSGFFESRRPVAYRLHHTLEILLGNIAVYIKDNRLYRLYQFPLHVFIHIFGTNFQPPSLNKRLSSRRLIAFEAFFAETEVTSRIGCNRLQRLFRKQSDAYPCFPISLI